MISTPYKALRANLRKPEDWQPAWAQHLEVRRHGDQTVYSAHPERLDQAALTELGQLAHDGWAVIIDSPRLNRLRVNIWQ